jgi:CO/xanthine dehydrogenase Mo-binding subunit
MATATPVAGGAIARRDAPQKLTGATKYASDTQYPGMLHARLVTSPYAAARIVSIDTAAAAKLPGVHAVYTGHDLSLVGMESGSRRLNFLARDLVVFDGQPVAVVLADTIEQAADGVEAVTVQYEELPVVMDPIKGMSFDAPTVRATPASGAEEANVHAAVAGGEETSTEKLPDNVTSNMHLHRGDVAKGFAEADAIVENTYKVNYVHQGYIEPQTCAIIPDPISGGVTVYPSTQAYFQVRDEVARALGLSTSQVRVMPLQPGGAFGAKYVLLDTFVASLVAKTNRPVKLVYTRSEEFHAANPSPLTIIEVKLGGKKDGTLTALEARVIFDTGSYSGSALSIGCLLLGGYYNFQNLDIHGYEVMTNKPGVGAYRAPGAPQASFAIESAMDELAAALGADPLDIRRQNAVQEGDLWPDGNPWPRIGLKECLEELYKHPLWQTRNNLGPNEGIGVGVGGWPGGRGPAAAACRMDPGGDLTITTGVADLTGQSTTFAMIAAEAFGMDPSKVRVVAGDTESAPHSPGSGGSQITYTVGKAVLEAAREARKQAIGIAATHLEASPDDMEIVDGEIRVKGAPESKVTLDQVYRLSTSKYAPIYTRGTSAQEVIAAGFAAHMARVHVDPDTGEVTVLDYVAVQDVGHALNPPLVEGQILGGAVQGLGFALYEEIIHDENGQLLTGSFMDYCLPRADQMPHIETIMVEVPTVDGPFGARIVGEPPIIPGAATIGNAIKAATGTRMTEAPMTAARVAAAMQE